MMSENPYHKVGGRPPLTMVKSRVFELIHEEVENAKLSNIPLMMLRSSDIMVLYKKKYHDAPDLKTLKKYLKALCDEGKIKARVVHDNKNTSSKRRRIRQVYEYNIEH
ncbi:MAG: hypothetical protein V1859_02580 [archaeon]